MKLQWNASPSGITNLPRHDGKYTHPPHTQFNQIPFRIFNLTSRSSRHSDPSPRIDVCSCAGDTPNWILHIKSLIRIHYQNQGGDECDCRQKYASKCQCLPLLVALAFASTLHMRRVNSVRNGLMSFAHNLSRNDSLRLDNRLPLLTECMQNVDPTHRCSVMQLPR